MLSPCFCEEIKKEEKSGRSPNLALKSMKQQKEQLCTCFWLPSHCLYQFLWRHSKFDKTLSYLITPQESKLLEPEVNKHISCAQWSNLFLKVVDNPQHGPISFSKCGIICLPKNHLFLAILCSWLWWQSMPPALGWTYPGREVGPDDSTIHSILIPSVNCDYYW